MLIKAVTLFTLTCLVGLSLFLTDSSAEQPKTQTYSINAAESNVWVEVGKGGLLSGLGHEHVIGVKSFSGRVGLPENNLAAATLELEIDAASLAVLDKGISEKDRKEITESMHQAVLESGKFAKISFRSVGIATLQSGGSDAYNFTLTGDLTLHGVTQRISFPVAVTLALNKLRATGKYTLKQTDFGIKPYSAGLGSIKVKNEVVITFAVVAKIN